MSTPTHDAEVVVIGGGIAGVSVAAVVAAGRRVVLVEQEDQLAQHATGRSAASFVASYGPAPIRSLTRASYAALAAMAPDGAPVLAPRPLLWAAFDDDAVAALDGLCQEVPDLDRLDGRAVRRLHDALRGDRLEGAIERHAYDIDVMAVHQSYLRVARAGGVEVWRGARALGADRAADGRLIVETTAGLVTADVVVNAAGAWADVVAEAFGAAPAGLRPLRRTLASARPSRPIDPDWPFVVDVGDGFYFKPDGPNVLVSPADETPDLPGDARAAEIDVALALDRVNAVTDLGLRSVPRSWAGLRTFAPDGCPVVGFDPDVAGLFWFAGQGGYGIQTASAMAEVAAALLDGRPVPDHIAAEGLDVADLRPGRPNRSSATT
jgi:D-arginine dehydrogenase